MKQDETNQNQMNEGGLTPCLLNLYSKWMRFKLIGSWAVNRREYKDNRHRLCVATYENVKWKNIVLVNKLL